MCPNNPTSTKTRRADDSFFFRLPPFRAQRGLPILFLRRLIASSEEEVEEIVEEEDEEKERVEDRVPDDEFVDAETSSEDVAVARDSQLM